MRYWLPPFAAYHHSSMSDKLLMWHITLHIRVYYTQCKVSARVWNARAYGWRSEYIKSVYQHYYSVADMKVTELTRGGSSRGAAGLQPSLKNVRQKIPPNGQTRLKSGFSCEISQHNHFRYFRHHFGSTFPRNPTKPMFRSFPTTPLMRWPFQHTCLWIWRFRGCLRHSPKGKKPNSWLQETCWYIRLSQSIFVILTMNL